LSRALLGLLGWLAALGLGFSPSVPEGSGRALTSGAETETKTETRVQSVLEALEASERVLWVGAHPDDETVAAGLLAWAKDVAGELYLVSLTHGENGDRVWGGLCRGSQLGEARAALFAQSAEILQADGFEVGPFVNGPHAVEELDGRCPPGAPFRGWPPSATSDDAIAKWRGEGDPLLYLVEVLRRWRPDAMVAMDAYCGVSGHPEHIAAARLLLEAIPRAADPEAYPSAREAWAVRFGIFSAHVIRPLIECGFCKCEGPPPQEPVEGVLTLEESRTHGATYFRVACRVAKSYQNTMEERGRTPEELEAECERAERSAQEAFRRGVRAHPIVERYRLYTGLSSRR